jgi:hypothetical protein
MGTQIKQRTDGKWSLTMPAKGLTRARTSSGSLIDPATPLPAGATTEVVFSTRQAAEAAMRKLTAQSQR